MGTNFSGNWKEFPDIKTDYAHVDAMTMWFVKNPEWFDVIVTDNMFGDIITDLGAMIQGGMGIAAGGVEFAACVLALRDDMLPPTINYETPDPECDLDYVPNHSRKIPVHTALSNSLGFGGHNATLVVKKFKE